MKFLKILVILSVILTAMACNNNEPSAPYSYELNPVYTDIGLGYYGAYYADYGYPNHVLSLQFFSDGMLNEDKTQIIAPGQYLLIDDLFISEEKAEWLINALNPVEGDNSITIEELLTLLEGSYQVSDTGDAYTFFPGEILEVDNFSFRTGARIYYLEESHEHYKMISGGEFTISASGVDFNLTTDDNKNLRGSYSFMTTKSFRMKYSKTKAKQRI